MRPLFANLLMLLAGILWGAGFVAQSTAMDSIGPFLFMTLRFALATTALVPLVIWEAKRSPAGFELTRREWFGAAIVGIAFYSAMSLQQIGILGTSVTNAGMLTGLYVVLTPILAFALFREHQKWIIWPCAATAFAGIWLLGGGGLDQLTWGDWVILVSAIFAALHVIAMGRTVTGLRRPALVATGQFAISAFLALICFIITRLLGWSQEPAFNVTTVIAAGPEIIYAAIFAGAIAFTIMATCQQFTTAANAAIILSSEALFAAIAGAIILGDRLSLFGYIGCGLLLAAIVAVSVAAAEEPAQST